MAVWLIAVSFAVVGAGHAPVQQVHLYVDSQGRSSAPIIRSESPPRAAVDVTPQGDQEASAFAEELSSAIRDQGHAFEEELQELQAVSATGGDDFEKMDLGKACDKVDSVIQTVDRCKQAAKKVSMHYIGSVSDKAVQNSKQFKGLAGKAPPGCFWVKVPQGNVIFFNDKMDDENTAPPIVGGICKKAAGSGDDEEGGNNGEAGEQEGEGGEAGADAAGDGDKSDNEGNSSANASANDTGEKKGGGSIGVAVGGVLVGLLCCGGCAFAAQISKQKPAPGQEEGEQEEGEGEEEEGAAEEEAPADAPLEEAAADGDEEPK